MIPGVIPGVGAAEDVGGGIESHSKKAETKSQMKTPQNGFTFTAPVERLLAFLALISVGAYVLEVEFAGSRNSLEGDHFWLWTERIIAAVLTLEYLARWRSEGHRYTLSVLGMIDIIAIIPFWIGFIAPVESLGLIRSMRILRLLKLYRHSHGMREFVHAFLDARRYLAGIICILVILILFGAVGIHEIEKEVQPDIFGSLFDCIWWTIVTLMSVGYGDAVPQSVLGKTFAQFLMLGGVALTAAFIGIVGSVVYSRIQEARK